MDSSDKVEKRNRTINWPVDVDQLAARLAAIRGYIQTEGGVSQFLADLVVLEGLDHPDAGFKKQLPAIREQIARLKEKSSVYGKKQK